MNPNIDKKPTLFLKHGSWWVEYEDCIVGTEEGLTKLRDACDEALASGDCYNDELDDFHGVVKVTDEWALKPEFPAESIPDKILGISIMIILGSSLLVGFFVIISWLWSFFSSLVS